MVWGEMRWVVGDLSRVPTPLRARRLRPTASAMLVPAHTVPGGVLPHEVEQRLASDLRALSEWQGRSRVSARTCWVGSGR